MGDYLTFKNEYGNKFVSDLSFEEYTKIKELLHTRITETLAFRGVKIDALDQLILYAMFTLLTKHSAKEIIANDYEDELEPMIKRV